MKIIKKISLIFIGTLLSLVFLEIGLQTVSFAITTIKNYKINKLLKNKDAITILCLGESTTDGQWPPILQKILDEKSKNKKFNVIDKARYACDTNDLLNLSLSDYFLKKNKIDIIISMMGINDRDRCIVSIKKTKFKTLKLFYLIEQHLVSNLFAQEQKICKERDFNRIFDIVYKYIFEKKFEEAINLLENIADTSLSPSQIGEKYDLLITAYFNYAVMTGKEKLFFSKLKKYILNFRNGDKLFNFYIYLTILIYERNIKEIEDLFHFDSNEHFVDFINQNFDLIMINIDKLKLLGMNELARKIEEIYNTINDNSNMDSQIRKTGYVALNHFINKEYTVSDNLFDLQTKILLNNKLKITTINYLKLYNICNNDNIQLIAMQYPVRSIKPLKEMLKFCDGTIFISNEENFKQALKTHKIEEIFNDRFAGDFGHCTELGNTLIAENVAETILKLYN